MKINQYSPSNKLVDMLKTEEMYVPWPYDDKGPWKAGKPIEYKGGPLKGTLSQGYGHTRAAGGKPIVLGVHWDIAEATRVMNEDMLRFLPQFKKEMAGTEGTQGMYDAMFSAYYNLSNKSFRQLIKPWKQGNPQGTYNKLPLYVMSGGERMRGLVRRREKEMNLWRNGSAFASSADSGRAGLDIAPEKVDNPDAISTGKKVAIGVGTAGAAVGGAIAEHTTDATSSVTDTVSNIQSYADTAAGIVYSVQSLFSAVPIGWIVAGAAAAGIGYVGYRIWKKYNARNA